MRYDEAAWKRLDELGVEWYNTRNEDDEAVRMNLETEIFELAMKLMDGRETEALGAFYAKRLKNFNPNKGSFSKYLSKHIENEAKNIYSEDFGLKRVKEDEDEINSDNTAEAADNAEAKKKTKRKKVGADSIDRPIHDKTSNQTLGNTIAAGSTQSDPIKNALDRVALIELLALILNLPKYLSEKEKGGDEGTKKITYYRMIFTDHASQYIQECEGEETAYYRHERDLFRAMKLAFLDFYMAKICRTIEQIQRSRLKPYGLIVKGKPTNEPPKQPLPIDVYMTYLNEIEHYNLNSDSTISEQRKAFYKFTAKHLS